MARLSKESAKRHYDNLLKSHRYEREPAVKVQAFQHDLEHIILKEVTGLGRFRDKYDPSDRDKPQRERRVLEKGQLSWLKENKIDMDRNGEIKSGFIPSTIISDIENLVSWRNMAEHENEMTAIKYLNLLQTMAQTIKFFSDVPLPDEIKNILNNQPQANFPKGDSKKSPPSKPSPDETVKKKPDSSPEPKQKKKTSQAAASAEKPSARPGNSRIYFAYGSNLNTAQMKTRCPDSKIIGAGTLAGYRLLFRSHSGKESPLTIEKAKKSFVPIGVYELSENDLKKLDGYEGVSAGAYRREELEIPMNGAKIKGLIYIMNKGVPKPPSNAYYNRVKQGYADFNFDLNILKSAYDECGGQAEMNAALASPEAENRKKTNAAKPEQKPKSPQPTPPAEKSAAKTAHLKTPKEESFFILSCNGVNSPPCTWEEVIKKIHTGKVSRDYSIRPAGSNVKPYLKIDDIPALAHSFDHVDMIRAGAALKQAEKEKREKEEEERKRAEAERKQKAKELKAEGIIRERILNGVFRVELDNQNGRLIIADISKKLRKHGYYPALGDHVQIDLSPDNLNRGKIIFIESDAPAADSPIQQEPSKKKEETAKTEPIQTKQAKPMKQKAPSVKQFAYILSCNGIDAPPCTLEAVKQKISNGEISRDYYIHQVGSNTDPWPKIDSIPELAWRFEEFERCRNEEYRKQAEKENQRKEEERRRQAEEDARRQREAEAKRRAESEEQNRRKNEIESQKYAEEWNKEEAHEHFNEGIEYYDKAFGDTLDKIASFGKPSYEWYLEDAKKEFSKAINLTPDFADAYYWRAKVHQKLDHKNAAVNDLQKAKKLGCRKPDIDLLLVKLDPLGAIVKKITG